MTRAALAALATFGAALSLPLWLAPYPPLQDLAGNVEVACQLLRIWRGEPAFFDVLFVHPQPWANSLPWVVLAALLAVSPSLAMAKLMLTLSLAGWLVSVGWLLARTGRSPWLAVVCAPLAIDLAWSYGFFHFLLAKPLVVAGAALGVGAVRAPTRARAASGAAGLAGVLIALFLVHSLAWLVACGCVVVLCAVLAMRARDVLLPLAALALSGLVALPFVRATAGRGPPGFEPRLREPTRALDALWGDLGDQSASAWDGAPHLLALCALALVLWAARADAWRWTRERAALVLCGACGLIAWARGPEVLALVSVVSPRLLSLAVAFIVIGLVPSTLAPRTRAMVVALMVLAGAVHIVDRTRQYRAFSQAEMGDFQALLARIPAGARVATHYTSPFSAHARHNALWHWGKLACLERGAMTDDLFAYRDTAYVEVRADARARFVRPPHRLKHDALAAYDALLLRGDARALRPLDDLLTPVGTSGSWSLFAIHRGATSASGVAP